MANSDATWTLDSIPVHVSHLDKDYWPQAGFTKGDMLRYYRDVAPALLPYLRDRPVTLRMYPNGVEGASYYQRDRPEHAPEWLRETPYHPKTAQHVTHLPLVDNSAGLIWLANAGSVEFHLWGCHLPDLSVPDLAIFDLDPGDTASFADALHAALRLREALDRLSMSGHPKTSGGKGLHVFVPLAGGHSFEDVRAWVKRLSEQLAADDPAHIAVGGGPTHRGTRVTVDYAQNAVGRNTATPYTLRTHTPAPTVSTPLSWDEVAAGGFSPADFTPVVVLDRIQRMGDLFAPVLTSPQRLSM
ncbi:MAG TPA: non-homologous end-joining DNA ligase [Ktedonobacterales bacterium]|nr:non-homologous end-joining DNA ligase [Ktedonobacterales bacterium]